MNSKNLIVAFKVFLKALVVIFNAILALALVFLMVFQPHERLSVIPASDIGILDSFDYYIFDSISEAAYIAKNVPKRFWLAEDTEKAPVPNPDLYGSTDDPGSLQWLLEDARTILDGQSTLFTTETPLIPGTEATYYLDETIFAVTWKQAFHYTAYTITEIKISDPSQFRRHLEDPVFDGPKLSTPTQMAKSVNAVVGTSADHYRGRKAGIAVYQGEVKRVGNLGRIDVCYVDKNGDLQFTYRGQISDLEAAQKYVDENDISFSMSFGPILIDNGQRCEPRTYTLGEINQNFARAAICQMGPLHYLVVVANREGINSYHPDIHDFAETLDTFGCQKAYALDGGNTGSIVMNGKLINRTTYGTQRPQGDIIYFCTAIPDKNT